MKAFKNFISEFSLLLRSLSPVVFSLFLLSLFSMNLLANKSLNIPLDWLALDCGILVSWVAFLCMDVLTKHFGPKAATMVSVLAIFINLVACIFLYLASLIPGTWGAFFDFGEQPVLGSTLAFIVSAIINNFSNWGIGKLFKGRDGFLSYACRTYLSTALGQFCDNLIFALTVSYFFFGWTIVQCLTCAATGMVAELLCEAAFSPLGFRIVRSWEKRGVGKEYLERKGLLSAEAGI